MKCVLCSKELTGKQTKFCSRNCMYKYNNTNHQSYLKQQERGLARKKMFIDERGGGCERCGYSKSIAALEFHHIDPIQKEIKLDLRNLSNRTLESCRKEVAKCEILCANCHREHHTIL